LALGIVLLGVRARRRPVSTGAEAMVGATAQAVADMRVAGQVRYGGELWNARTLRPMHAGQNARIIKVEGLVLWVDPMDNGTAVPQQVQELS
jgi:membrane-bound serine protease (ClpP class)